MKKLLCLLLSFLLFLSAFSFLTVIPAAALTEADISVMSFNTLYSTSNNSLATVALSDGLKRSAHILNVITTLMPDIIGWQERNSTSSYASIMTSLSYKGYKLADTKRTDSTSTDVQTPIMFNSNVFTLQSGTLAHGCVKLNDSYDKISGGTSKCVAWAVLKHNTTGQLLLALNTHMAVYVDGYVNYTSADAVNSRADNAKQCVELIKTIYRQWGELPTVFTGDFNMRQNERGYRILTSLLSDTINYAPDAIYYESSFHESITTPETTRNASYPIDHIFMSDGDFTVFSNNVLNDNDEQRVMTDHYAVMAKLRINAVPAPNCSHNTGIYTFPQTVSLSAPGSGNKIYYTTDGSDPLSSVTAKVYSGPLKIIGDTALKAVTLRNGVYSDIMTVNFAAAAELLITEIAKNTPGYDFFEGIEVINVSAHDVDISDYRIWSVTSTDYDTLCATNPSSVTANMLINPRAGKYIIKPGEVAYIWLLFSDHYKYYDNFSGKYVYYTELDKETNQTIYRTDYAAGVIAADRMGNVTENMIIPCDRTASSYFTSTSGVTLRPDTAITTSPTSLTSSFNLGNATFNRIYLTYAWAETAAEAFCIANLDKTDNGTYASGSSLVAKEGSYNYLPGQGAMMQTMSFSSKCSFGSLLDSQTAAYAAVTQKKITYTDEGGGVIDTQPSDDGKALTLPGYTSASGKIFVGWEVSEGATKKLYPSGAVYTIKDNVVFRAVCIDFKTLSGASVRVTAPFGLRFQYSLAKSDLNTLSAAVGADNISFGLYIAPTQYVNEAGAFTPEAFAAVGRTKYIDIPAQSYYRQTDMYNIYSGSVVNIREENIAINFSGVGYIKIKYADNSERKITTAYSRTEQSRCIYSVAYDAFSDRKAISEAGYDNFVTDNGVSAYSPYTTQQLAWMKSIIDRFVSVTIDIGVTSSAAIANENQYYEAPYTVSYDESLEYLTITPTAEVDLSQIKGIYIDGSLSKFFSVVNGVISVRYSVYTKPY